MKNSYTSAEEREAQIKIDASQSQLVEKHSKDIWKKLSAIDVNEHTEEKNGLTYLSWAWAYQTMMDNYPSFDYAFVPNEMHDDKTMTVHCYAKIPLGSVEVQRYMWLPVMDFRNKAITDPNSVDINKAKMRCLTKCISMFGLGAYIYAGEDLPQQPADEPEDKPNAKVTSIKKKAAKKTKAKKVKVKEADPSVQKDVEEDFYLGDEDEAEEFAMFMMNTAEEMHSNSMENLVSFWQKNLHAVNYMQKNYPDQFEQIKAKFSEIKATLMEQDDD